ncbi:MAG: hypothetical protein JWN70_2232 [Planctomycetaceae bacterium]|nr:hypothetical protein [Planctomycetaceae bacterium]
MINLSRKQIHMIRATIRQSLGVTSIRRAPSVTFQTTSDALTIRAADDEIAIEYRLPGNHQSECFAVPYEALAVCEGRQEEPVQFEKTGDLVTLRWSDVGVPQSAPFAASEPVSMPATPGELAVIDPHFLRAMADACNTVAYDSTRYALNCVRLRGTDGQMAATDGQQALIQTGFRFPWENEVLVPASAAFAAKSICRSQDVAIGRSPEWMFVRADAWTIALKIEKDRRFPAVDSQIPEIRTATTTLSLAEEDAEFLVRAAKRLPGSEEANAPVTLDLNGAAVIRAQATGQHSPTDLVLSNSRRIGDELKVSTDRSFVERAMQLGFREIYLRDVEAPAFCRDKNRSYIWALLGKNTVLTADATAIRIESPIRQSVSTTFIRPRAPLEPPKSKKMNSGAVDSESILTTAEALRSAPREVLGNTRALITAIKQRRKQNRLVDSTLRSLKELQTNGA